MTRLRPDDIFALPEGPVKILSATREQHLQMIEYLLDETMINRSGRIAEFWKNRAKQPKPWGEDIVW